MSGQTTPTPEEMQQLLYGDLGKQPESSHGSQAGAMDLDEGLLEENQPEEAAVTIPLDGFGDNFSLALQKFLGALRPFASTPDSSQRSIIYSAGTRTRVTEEVRKASAPLFEELLDALMADKKIFFKKAENKPITFATSMGLFCPCEMVHAAITQCPHFADRHAMMCQQVVDQAERRIYERNLVNSSTQTEFKIPKIPAEISATVTAEETITTSPTATTSKVIPASRGGYGSNRGFSRGGNRGRSSGSSEGRGNSRSKNRRRGSRDNRDRSRSEFSRENRDTRDYNSNSEKSHHSESRSSSDDRGRSKYKWSKPHQPAQNRLQEDRKRMEDPENRRKTEEVAASAKKAADQLVRELELACPSTSATSAKGHGDSTLGHDGKIDYTTVPVVSAPVGMRAKVSIVKNCWNIEFVSKD